MGNEYIWDILGPGTVHEDWRQMSFGLMGFPRASRRRAAMIRSALAGLALLLTVCVASPGSARVSGPLREPASAGLPIWQQTFYKTVTYQTAIDLPDAVLFYGPIHASGPAPLGFAYGRQTTGAIHGPERGPSLAAKTTVFQTLNAGRFCAVSYLFGRGILGSVTLTAAATGLDTAVFVTNEYAWGPIGPRPEP